MAFDSLINEVKTKKADFAAAGISYTPERDEEVDFSINYVTSKQVVLVKTDSNIESINNISKEKIASGLKIIKVSTDNKNADLYMEHYDENTYKVYYNGAFLMMLTINLLGRHNLMNILESVAVALYLKIDPKDIKDAVEKIESVPHRLSVNYDGCYRIIDDAFNSNVKGFKGALEVLRKETNFKVIITPGIVDGGSYLERINSSLIIDLMNSCDLILLIKNEASKIIELGLKTADYHRYLVFDSFKEAYAYLKKTYPSTSMTILIENDLPDSFLRR